MSNGVPEPTAKYRIDIEVYKENSCYPDGTGNEVLRLLQGLVYKMGQKNYVDHHFELRDKNYVLTGLAELVHPRHHAYDTWTPKKATEQSR